MTLSAEQAERVAVIARELHTRYSTAFVEAFHLCPWAKRARESGDTLAEVLPAFAGPPDPADAIARLEASDAAVAFLLFPGFEGSRREFERWVAAQTAANAEQHGGSPPFAWAAFHPAADFDASNAATLVPFVRRSADPTIQMIRRSALESVRKPSDSGTAFVDPSSMSPGALAAMLTSAPPLHERVGDANLSTLQGRKEEAESVLNALIEERDRRYREVLSP